MAEKGGYKHFMLKEIYEQPRAVRDTVVGRVEVETGRVFLDEMDISPKEFREFRAGENRRLRHELARGAGRQVHDREAGADSGGGGLRQRVPLPRSHSGSGSADGGDHAIGRDGGHAGGAARGQAEGLEDAGHLQRARLDGDAGGLGDGVHARRTGDRRGLHQGLHHAACGAVPARAAPGAGAGDSRRGELPAAGAGTPEIPAKLEAVLSHDAIYEELAKKYFRARDFLFLAAASTFRSPWKAR